MGDLAKQKAWHQDPKLELCRNIPGLREVLEKVRLPSHLTPGLISHLYRTCLPAYQVAGKRKINVSGNPNDVACLGEDAIGSELQNTCFTPELNLIRKPKSFVGLKNLGATCYMNCMLQALFHNTEFRAGVYAWVPEDEQNFSPVVRQLQLVFAFLQDGVKAYYDPTPFTKEINLATQVQQDVQEFFKALTTFLEEQFGHAADPAIRRLVQDQFSGTMAYVTQCKHCNTASKRESLFYELDMTIDGVPTIERSIENYIKSELLQGDNQYHCGHCDAKRDAERFIELASLPPILNFQLMRFVFDWETETKKKVKSAIEFPEIIDMSDFVRQHPSPVDQDDAVSEDTDKATPKERRAGRPRKNATNSKKSDNTLLYQLTYVLVHRGQSAYGGHYIAFVRDEETGQWWKFNDEETSPVLDLAKALASNADIAPGVIKTSKKAPLIDADFDIEEEEEKTKSKKGASKKASATDNKNSGSERFKSGSAYMLGYTRVGHPGCHPTIPKDVAAEVELANQSFQSLVDERKKVAAHIEATIEKRKRQRTQLEDATLFAEPDEEMPVLSENLNGDFGEEEGDQSSGPSKSKKTKKPKYNDRDLLGLTPEDIQTAITNQLGDCRWIPTEWLVSWHKGGKLTDSTETAVSKPVPAALPSSNSELQILDPNSMEVDAQVPEVVEISHKPVHPSVLNNRLMCKHGRLDPLKTTQAKRISVAAWNLLVDWEGIGPELTQHSLCTDCALDIFQYGTSKLESDKSKGELLQSLKSGKDSATEIEPSFWISKDWLANYSKKTFKIQDLDPTINSSLVCPHGLLSPDSAKFRRRISKSQWLALKASFPTALEFPSALSTAPLPKPEKETKGTAKATAKATGTRGKPGKKAAAAKPASYANSIARFTVKSTAAASPRPQKDQMSAAVIDIDDDDVTILKPSTRVIHDIKSDPFAFPDNPDDLVPSMEQTNMDIDPDLTDVPLDGSFEEKAEKVVEEENGKLEEHEEQDEGDALVDSILGKSSVMASGSDVSGSKRTSTPGARSKVDQASDEANSLTEEMAEELDTCNICYKALCSDLNRLAKLSKEKAGERKKLSALFKLIPGSIQQRQAFTYHMPPTKPGSYFVLSLDWAIRWRNYLKDTTDTIPSPGKIDNSNLICEHNLLISDIFSLFGDSERNTSFVLVSSDVWNYLKSYGFNRFYKLELLPAGVWARLNTCQECMDLHHIQNETRVTNFELADLNLAVEDHRTNKRTKTALQKGGSKKRALDQIFIGRSTYSDTVGTTKMKIFEKYDVVPAEMLLVTHDGKVMDNEERTLEYYGVRSDHPLTVRLVDPMEREVYRAGDERNAGFGATVLMGGGSKKAQTADSNNQPATISPSDEIAITKVEDRITTTADSNGMEVANDEQKPLEIEEEKSGPVPTSIISPPAILKEEPPNDEEDDPELAAAIKRSLAETSHHAASPPHRPTSPPHKNGKRGVNDVDPIVPAVAATSRARSPKPQPKSVSPQQPNLDAWLQSSNSELGNWTCSQCSYSNAGILPYCEQCNTPSSLLPKWTCSTCNIQMKADTERCQNCHRHRLAQDISSDEEDEDRPPMTRNSFKSKRTSRQADSSSNASHARAAAEAYTQAIMKKKRRSRDEDEDEDYLIYEREESDDEPATKKKRRARVAAEDLTYTDPKRSRR